MLKWTVSLIKPIIGRYSRVAKIYRCIRDQLDFLIEESWMTPWGFTLAGNESMAKGTFEPHETQLVRDLLKDVDILVNVGANIGYYCCHALSMGKQVIAFEPIHRNLRYLYKNIKTNGWSKAEIYPIALSNSIGITEIYGGSTGASLIKGWAGTPDSYITYVPSSTMDVVLGTRLHGKRTLVLIDVEGGEKWVLDGANIMLANDPKPIWIVEITTKDQQPFGVEFNPNFSSTFRLFFAHNYQAFLINQDIKPITMEDVDSVSAGRVKLDSHNFLFREPQKE